MRLAPVAAFLLVVVVMNSAFAQIKTTTPVVAAPAAAAVGSAGAMKPGLWEIAVVIDVAGTNSRRTVTSRSCYSAADVANAAQVLPVQREVGLKCENRDVKAQGDAVSWAVACTGQNGSMAGKGTLTLGADGFAGQASLVMKSDAKTGAKSQKVQQSMAGRRLGECQ